MIKKVRTIGEVSPSAIEDAWQRRATTAAVAGARGIVRGDGPIPPGTPVGRLGDTEWGWIVAAILFGWIQTRAEQATAENLSTEQTVRMTGLDPDPWDAGAVSAVLPELAEACSDVDWTQPVTAWPKETMTQFLLAATRLIKQAVVARDLSDKGITRKSNADVIAREANAAAGSPLMKPNEFNDEIGF